MTEQELKEIEAREKAATPGPWHKTWVNQDNYFGWFISRPNKDVLIYNSAANPNCDANTEFLVEARSDISKLTAEVRRLREVIKKAQHAGDFCDDPSCPWCMARPWEKHTSECPAFTPEGEVK